MDEGEDVAAAGDASKRKHDEMRNIVMKRSVQHTAAAQEILRSPYAEHAVVPKVFIAMLRKCKPTASYPGLFAVNASHRPLFHTVMIQATVIPSTRPGVVALDDGTGVIEVMLWPESIVSPDATEPGKYVACMAELQLKSPTSNVSGGAGAHSSVRWIVGVQRLIDLSWDVHREPSWMVEVPELWKNVYPHAEFVPLHLLVPENEAQEVEAQGV